jgi:hypothetical protein
MLKNIYSKLKNQNINKIFLNKYSNNISDNNDINKKLHIPVMLNEVIKYLVDDAKDFRVNKFFSFVMIIVVF